MNKLTGNAAYGVICSIILCLTFVVAHAEDSITPKQAVEKLNDEITDATIRRHEMFIAAMKRAEKKLDNGGTIENITIETVGEFSKDIEMEAELYFNALNTISSQSGEMDENIKQLHIGIKSIYLRNLKSEVEFYVEQRITAVRNGDPIPQDAQKTLEFSKLDKQQHQQHQQDMHRSKVGVL